MMQESYCPYTNLGERAYLPILATTSLSDSEVMYWEPAKYVARMRAQTAGAPTTLFKINLDAGHGGASGRHDYLREITFNGAWVLEEPVLS